MLSSSSYGRCHRPACPRSLSVFQAEDGIRDLTVTGVQTCALPISSWLSKDVEITLCNGIGVEHRVGLVRRLDSARITDRAVDHEMGDVNALGRELACHAQIGRASCRERV